MHLLTKKTSFPSKTILALTIAGIASAGSQAYAQNSSVADDSDNLLEEVEVVASYRGALRSALEAKRNASQIVDGITAEDIGQFPSENLAEALQGITGVAMSRQDGVGEFISIRGMDASLTKVTINGRSVSMTAGSSDPSNATTLSFFSADMFSSAEVSKSPLAKDVEGGVGGTVRMKTRKPLDVGKFKAGMSVTGGDNTRKDDVDYKLGGFYNNVFMDQTLGLTLAASYSDKDRRIDKIDVQTWKEGDSGAFEPKRVRQEARVGTQERYNISGTLQFQPNDNLDLYTDFLFAHENRDETLHRFDTTLNKGVLDLDSVVVAGGTLIEADYTDKAKVAYKNFGRDADIEQSGITFGGSWSQDDWSISSSISASESEEDRIEAGAEFEDSKVGVSFNGNNAEVPYITINSGLADIELTEVDFTRRAIGTEEIAFRLDGEMLFGDSFITTAYIGYHYSDKETSREQGSVDGSAIDGFVNPEWDTYFPVDDYLFDEAEAGMTRTWPSVDMAQMLSSSGAASRAIVFDPEKTWKITEEAQAVYSMADFETETMGRPVSGNFGVRAIQYEYEGEGSVGVLVDSDGDGGEDPVLVYEASNPKNDDFYVLPSFNAKIGLNEEGDQLLRVAVAKVYARPSPRALNSNETLDTDGEVLEVGNPELDPYLAWQYDIGYEYYFGDTQEGLFSFGVFYKDVENFFEEVTYEGQDLSSYGGILAGEIDTYVNGGAATVVGFETGFQTPLSFLPEGWNNLGVLANYTYVDSERETLDGETADMPGTSQNTANFVVYYEKSGFDVRAIFNYRDSYLEDQASQEYVDGSARIDLALRYKMRSGLKISADVSNLTEETEYSYNGVTSRMLTRQLEGRRISVGLKYDF